MLGNFEQLIHSACIASYIADTLLDAGDTVVIRRECAIYTGYRGVCRGLP